MADLVQIDDTGMWLGAIPNQTIIPACQINGKSEPVFDQRLSIDQADILMQFAQFVVVQSGFTRPEPDLVQPHAGTHQNRE